jgi:hypothetical protein
LTEQASEKKWPELHDLFTAYLNQDVLDEYTDPWEAVADFKRREPEGAARRAAEEAVELAASSSDDQELDRAIGRLGVGYLPGADGWRVRDWLVELARLLRA